MKLHHYLLVLLLPIVAACKPAPPSPETPPEPKATAMRAAIQQPLDKAHAVEADAARAAEAQRAAIDAATE